MILCWKWILYHDTRSVATGMADFEVSHLLHRLQRTLFVTRHAVHLGELQPQDVVARVALYELLDQRNRQFRSIFAPIKRAKQDLRIHPVDLAAAGDIL